MEEAKPNLKNRYTAFSLVQLLVVMGIIAAILAIGVSGFQILLKSSRESQRESALGEISAQINKYKIDNLTYPNSVEFNGSTFTIGGGYEIDLNNAAASGAETTESTTKYYYNKSGSGYALCAELESGSIKGVGTVDCPATI